MAGTLRKNSVTVAAAAPFDDGVRLGRRNGRSIGSAGEEAEGDDGADQGFHGELSGGCLSWGLVRRDPMT